MAELKSALAGANLSDFGDDDAHPVVGTQTAPLVPKPPRPRVHQRMVSVPVPTPPAAPAGPEPLTLQDFGVEEEEERLPIPTPQVAPPPAAPTAPAETTGHVHPPQILDLAAKWGIGADEAGLYSREELRKELLRLRREDTLRTQPQTPAPAPAPQPEPDPQINWGTHDAPDGQGKRAWTDDDLSPAVVAAMKAHAKEIADLKKQIVALTTHTRQQSVAPIIEKVKAEVAKYGAFFGHANPQPGSPEHTRCMMVMQALDGFGNQGRSPRPEVDVPEVMKLLFGLDAPGQAAPAPAAPPAPRPAPVAPQPTYDPELEAINRGFAEGTVQRPTNRSSPDLPKGKKRAEKAFADGLRKRGIEPEGGYENDDTEFS